MKNLRKVGEAVKWYFCETKKPRSGYRRLSPQEIPEEYGLTAYRMFWPFVYFDFSKDRNSGTYSHAAKSPVESKEIITISKKIVISFDKAG